MNMQTFFDQSLERQFELIAEAKRKNWFFDTGVSAASPEQVEEWVLIHEDERPLSEKERVYWMSDHFDPDSL